MNRRSAVILRHLSEDYTEPIRDPLWNHIYLTPGLKRILMNPLFLKLSRIKQLGPAHLVYPGATHTRFNHSLGVFHLAKHMISALLQYDSGGDFSLEGVKSFLCASLLHDLGHFPYAHSLKDLPLRTHEALTADIILDSDLTAIIREEIGADPLTTAAIVDLARDTPPGEEVAVFRRVLSGVLDPDKLDYLNRDAYFCGVSYGIQDADYIVSKLLFEPGVGVVLDEPGLLAVENVLFSKYLMYRTVYWHKTVRIATAMIKKALITAMKDGVIVPEDLYGLDDEQFFRRFSPDRIPSFSLISDVPHRRLHKLVWEEPFVEDRSDHCRLMDLDARLQAERAISSELSAHLGRPVSEDAVIIDIPEPISFEVNLSIRRDQELVQFMDSDTVFGGPVVAGFTRALRRLRVFLEPSCAGELDRSAQVLTWIT